MMADGYFDERVAAGYDASLSEMSDPAVLGPAVDFLEQLAQGGSVLELGIGTGRVALPLAARGLRVHGIDLSTSMVAQMREKPGGEEIDVTIGDFASTQVDGSFRLAYLVFNTIMNLTTQAEQVACFRNVAAHLEPGGCFVIEVEMPDLQRVPFGETIRAYDMRESKWSFDVYDIPRQGLVSHHCTFTESGLDQLTIPFRYVWPAELDLMAQLAGMNLRERWGGWSREPFTNVSRKHVSVWVKQA